MKMLEFWVEFLIFIVIGFLCGLFSYPHFSHTVGDQIEVGLVWVGFPWMMWVAFIMQNSAPTPSSKKISFIKLVVATCFLVIPSIYAIIRCFIHI